MRLVHLATDLGTPGSGVAEKIVRTVDSWRRHGAEATMVDAASGEVVEGVPPHRYSSPPTSRLGWLARSEANAGRVLATLDRLRPDVVYTREMIWTPTVEAIAEVLVDEDEIALGEAHWAAAVSGGHVGRARRLATDPEARDRRNRALGLARDAVTPARAYAAV